MCRQRATHRLATREAPDHAARLIGSGVSGARRFGNIRLELLELQFRLVEQFAAAFGRGAVAMMLKLGDHQLQMGHHRLCTDRPGLSLPTCRALGSEFSACSATMSSGSTAVFIAQRNLSLVAVHQEICRRSPCQPAISGRQVRCGCRQSMPSSEGLQEYPLW